MKESEIKNIIRRYNERYNKFGYSEESLGWSRNKNDIRFDALIRFWKDELNNSSICDFGCGFGDFFKHLEQRGVSGFKYYGIDINDTLLLKGKELYPAAEFWLGNILDKSFPVKVDFTFSSGVFNHKLESTDEYENIEASIMEISKFTNKGFAINFLSDKVDYFTESNFNSNPGKIIEICYKISNNVILCNDYMPFEFTVYVRKDIGIDSDKLIYSYE